MKMKPSHTSHCICGTRHAVRVEVQQQILARRRDQGAVELIAPAVKAAEEQRGLALHFLERVVPPEELVAAVRADIVQGADDVVLAAHQMTEVCAKPNSRVK